MKIALITDAWQPQVNGVVTTLVELVTELEKFDHQFMIIHPGLFNTRPCPGYAGIDLAIRPRRYLQQLLQQYSPDAIHIVTEGPLGWAARSICLNNGWFFTSAFHTKFPEIFKASLGIPLFLGYAVLKHFHQPSSGVMVPTQSVLEGLQNRGFQNLKSWSHGVDTELFRFHEKPAEFPTLGRLPRPISLFVGRISMKRIFKRF